MEAGDLLNPIKRCFSIGVSSDESNPALH